MVRHWLLRLCVAEEVCTSIPPEHCTSGTKKDTQYCLTEVLLQNTKQKGSPSLYNRGAGEW